MQICKLNFVTFSNFDSSVDTKETNSELLGEEQKCSN